MLKVLESQRNVWKQMSALQNIVEFNVIKLTSYFPTEAIPQHYVYSKSLLFPLTAPLMVSSGTGELQLIRVHFLHK